MKRIFLLSLLAAFSYAAHACTNLIIGKKASADGSVMISYSADSFGAYGFLNFHRGGSHPKGTMRPLYHYESLNYLGEIPQADSTYRVVGLINEHQLAIHETTFGGREELVDTAGLLDYGSLMYITLERARTAREAIQVMANLVNTYGYSTEGESFSIADPNEAWIMEMIGKGPGNKGAVWVAVRIPDDCICAHANQSRIRQFPLNDKENCLYSPDVISFAREKGYFNGRNEDFSFQAAYSPTDFSAQRYCEARVWAFFNAWAAEPMDQYLPYAQGDTQAQAMPLCVRPKKPLSLQDVKDMMRNQYEDTPLATTHDLGAGPWDSPYRPSPLSFEVDGKKYFNERPIATMQSATFYVTQLRGYLPDYIGGVLWFGNDDPKTSIATPLYCCLSDVPQCYRQGTADAFNFSFQSAYWMQNWVSNMVYDRYSMRYPALRKVQERLDRELSEAAAQAEQQAQQMTEAEARASLNAFSQRAAQLMMDEWMQLAQHLIVSTNDMVLKATDSTGRYLKTPGGEPARLIRPGYSKQFRKGIVDQTGDQFLVPKNN